MTAWQRYWMETPAAPARMVLLRVAFFGLLGVDLWLKMIEHAPRYGAGGFNVPQIPALDAVLPLPTPAVVTALWLLGGFLAFRAALGLSMRTTVPALAVVYGGVYLWSQADSYQHHYFVALLLILMSFVPERVFVPAAGPATGPASPPTSWALRLVYAQVAFLYLWATVTKLDARWLDGSTLQALLTSASARAEIGRIGGALGLESIQVFALLAWGTVLLELGAAFAYVTRRLMLPFFLGLPVFHYSIEVFEFDIDLFSYYMIALNGILLMPEGWVRRLGPPLERLRGRLEGVRARVSRPLASGPAMALALGTGAVCAYLSSRIPLEGGVELAALVFVAVVAAQWPWDAEAASRAVGRAAAHGVLAAGLLGTLALSSVPYDYYRLWGGDLRRRGDPAGAIEKYERANALTDGPARHMALAALYEDQGRVDEARALLEEDVKRYEAALVVDKARARSARDPEPHEALADRHGDLADRCEKLARAVRSAGDAERAGLLERQALTHRADAKAALAEAQARGRRGGRGARSAD